MLIVNWKKHYYVPSIYYNDIRFTSTRKGKFFFISDFVFRIIHKFCFKLCLYYYIRYLFFYRFQKTCSNLNKYLSSFSKPVREYVNNTNFYIYRLYQKNEKDKWINQNINLKKTFYFSFNLFFCISFFLKTKMEKFNHLFFIFMSIYIKKKNCFFIKFFYNFTYKVFFILKNLKRSISPTFFFINNILFSLYVILSIRNLINILIFKYHSLSCSISVFKSYVKQVKTEENQMNVAFLQESKFIFESKCAKIMELLKLKNVFHFDNSWKKNYLIYFNFFANNFNNLLSYFFSFKKIRINNTLSFLNYANFNNLTIKKELIFKFKKQFRIFKKKLYKYRRRYMYRFYKFLVRVLYVKKNWLLGPVHKIKFFKYLFFIYKKVKNTFKKLFFLNTPYSKKKKKLSFFFDSSKIREHFFIFLGKKRYSEEFLLLKNKKWYFKFYLKQYYDIDFLFLSRLYFELRKSYKIKQLKDLFLFLEYNVYIFIKKFISYNLFSFDNINNNVMVNNVELNLLTKQLFNIGDLICLSSNTFKFFFYYEKIFIFFNIVFSINPLLFKNKQTFLYSLYKKIYYFYNSRNFLITFGNDMNMTTRSTISIFLSSMSINKKTSFNSMIFFIHLLKKINLDYKNYIKVMFFFFRKYNLLFSHTFDFNLKKNSASIYHNSSVIKYFYSFEKKFIKYQILNYSSLSKQHLKRIRKPFWWFRNIRKNKCYWRRKKRIRIKKKINFNVYKFLKYTRLGHKTNNSKELFYKDLIQKKLFSQNFNTFFSKKLFFLNKNKKKNIVHLFYSKY